MDFYSNLQLLAPKIAKLIDFFELVNVWVD